MSSSELITMKYAPFFLLLSLLYAACTASTDGSERVENINARSEKERVATLPEAVNQINEDWIKAVNSLGLEKLSTFYWEKAGLFSEGAFIQSNKAIADRMNLIMQSVGELSMKTTDFVIRQDSNHYFETGQYQFLDTARPNSVFVIAWKNVNGSWLRELEIINPLMIQKEVDLKEIDQARKLWQERSNAQDHAVLVAKSYVSEAYYFNRGQLYRGTESINEVYSYMSDPNWSIVLMPLSVTRVQDDLVYELGQYKSAGIGHYVILWEQQEDGTWQVLLDFNF